MIRSVSLALPRLQTVEELGLPAAFQKAVEEELSRDEKLVWLGRPSRNGSVQPPKKILMVVGAVLLSLAALLPLLFKGMSFIFPVALATERRRVYPAASQPHKPDAPARGDRFPRWCGGLVKLGNSILSVPPCPCHTRSPFCLTQRSGGILLSFPSSVDRGSG